MNSATDAATFLRKLEKFIPLFEGGDPDPLSFRQKRQFHAWKALLDSNPTSGNSKSRVHARKKARNFALKVIDTAGRETLLLCILVYSISGLPKITFQRFYLELKKWSQRACFPELLVEQASKLWNQSDQRGSQQRESSSQQRQLETENTQPGQTIVEAAIPSMSYDMVHDSSEEQSNTEHQHATRLQDYQSDGGPRSSTRIYNRIQSDIETNKPLEMAFLVPPNLLDVFYTLHKESMASQQHSAILTIPTHDHVASLVLSIPRTEAVLEGDKHNLPVIFNSGYPFA